MQEVEYIVSEYKKQIDRLSKDLTEQLSNPKFYDEKGAFNKQRKIALLKQLKDDLLRLDVTSRSFLKTIKGAYTINVEDSLRLFEMTTGKKFEGDWNYVDSKDILRLQDEYINYMQQGQEKYYKGIQNQLSAMELENKKHIAEIVKDQANNQIIGGDLRKQSVANIMQKMTDYGMTSFIYADSLGNMRSINLKSYAEIQIRSSIAYATNQAVVDSNEQLENDLVQFSTHYTTCPVCGTYAEGRVYTTNKNRTDYPYLNDIPGFNKGYNQIHPRCKHRITAYYEDYSDNVEEVKKHSNNLTDTRTEAQKKQYDNEQKLNQLRYAKKNNLEKRKSLADSQLDKDKRKIKRLEETSRKYTQRIKEVKESSSKLDIRPVEKVKEVVKKEIKQQNAKEIFKKIDLKGIDESFAQQIEKRFVELNEKYPLNNKERIIKTIKSEKVFGHQNMQLKTSGKQIVLNNEISISNENMKNLDISSKKHILTNRKRGCPSLSELHTIDHEYAHAIDSEYALKNNKELLLKIKKYNGLDSTNFTTKEIKEINSINEELFKSKDRISVKIKKELVKELQIDYVTLEKTISKELGSYASTETAEFFAEAFAVYRNVPSYEHTKFVKTFGEIFEKLFKEVF